MKNDLESREHHHEQRRALSQAELSQRAQQLGRELERHEPAVRRRFHRRRQIEGQLEHRHTRELVLPVLEIMRQARPRKALSLPGRVVGVLQVFVTTGCGPASREHHVPVQHFARQNTHRPGVGDQMMEAHAQDVTLLAQAVEPGTNQPVMGDIERSMSELRGKLLGPRLGIGLLAEVRPLEIERARIAHARFRISVDRYVVRAQDLVTSHHLVERGEQRRQVWRSLQRHGASDVVSRAARVDLMQEPHAFLGVGQG